MQRGRMGGRFFVVPFEVYDRLKELRASCRDIYETILRYGFIEEDWNTDGEWVTGFIRLNKNELMRLAGRKTGGRFYTETWPDLIAAGLVMDTQDGIISLPMLKKKSDAAISLGEIRAMQTRIHNLEDAVSQNGTDAQRGLVRPRARPHEASLGVILDGGHPINGSRRIDPEEEEEVKVGSVANSQKKEAVPGSRLWIISRLDELWPGRGYKKDMDDDYLAQLEKFSAAALDEAFVAAKKARIKRGNFDWILNRLENPQLFIKKKGGPAAQENKKAEAHVGTLEADWLDSERED